MLVWYELHGDIYEAIARKKRIKLWRRNWKISLTEQDNPHWIDLYPRLIGNKCEMELVETLS